ncbi:hypothetical protein P879_11642, partial [Paragonimus westermani]
MITNAIAVDRAFTIGMYVYEGQRYKLSLEFGPNYPYSPPTVRFVSRCYHPNVDIYGTICLDILKEKWSPLLTVENL